MEKGEKFRLLKELREKTGLGGGPEKIQELRKIGKMTARERVEHLLDLGSFVELGPFAAHQCVDFGMESKKVSGDGIVTGYGKIDKRLVYVFAHDITVFGGSAGETFARKTCKVIDMAIKAGAPVVGLIDSVGVRVQEGLPSLAGCGETFFRNVMASGVIPQISAVLGACAGAVVHSPAVSDFVLMVKGDSYMFTAGPDVIESPAGRDVSLEELGGAVVHNQLSGTAHVLANDEDECLRQIRRLMSYLPSNNLEDPPRIQSTDDSDRKDMALDNIIPENRDEPYDMKEIVLSIVDDHGFFEIHPLWAQNIIVGFARLNGGTVGIVGNQPKVSAGALDINASTKAARFVRFCDAFNIPLLTFVDAPGFLPNVDQEHGGIIRHGSKLLYAYCEATVPKITVITRKAYGAAYIVMSSKHIRGDINYAWPSAEVAVTGPEGAVKTIFGKEIAQAEDPEARINELATEYRNRFANPYIAAEKGYIDDVIMPNETRPRIIGALEALATKRESRPPRKHGNITL